MLSLSNLKKELREKADLKRAEGSQRYFKTGLGQYGEGDIFIGVNSAGVRSTAKKYTELNLADTQKLLNSKIHEERQVALLILIQKFIKGIEEERKKVFNLYLKNTRNINNWDLVDLSAPKIVGEHLKDKDRKILYKLAKSKDLWEKRISIISTFSFIREDDFVDTLKISEILLNDDHDLIHKAVGWMLREVGKRSIKEEEKFLKKHYKKMPRTMLRYAIEKFPEEKRQAYLKGGIPG